MSVYITGSIMKDWRRILPQNPETKGYYLAKGDILISLGSVGIPWMNPMFSPEEIRRLNDLDDIGYTFCFIDGNHENFDFLNSIQKTVWHGGRIHRIGRNIVHLIRGEIFNFQGKSFLAFGGGESSDLNSRKEHYSWWRDEKPSMEDFGTACRNIMNHGNKVDYILTHESPFDESKKDTFDKIQTIMHHTDYSQLYYNGNTTKLSGNNTCMVSDTIVEVVGDRSLRDRN